MYAIKVRHPAFHYPAFHHPTFHHPTFHHHKEIFCEKFFLHGIHENHNFFFHLMAICLLTVIYFLKALKRVKNNDPKHFVASTILPLKNAKYELKIVEGLIWCKQTDFAKFKLSSEKHLWDEYFSNVRTVPNDDHENWN